VKSSSDGTSNRAGPVRRLTVGVLRWLGSLRLAVPLLVVLAVVLAIATVLEAAKGREYAQWFVYDSRWFVTLLGLLAANIAAATLSRFPWRARQLGFIVVHAGLLLLLGGAIQTFLSGIEGQLEFAEGATANSIVIPERSQFKLLKRSADTFETTDYSFTPGAVDWPEEDTLDFGQDNGIGLKVLRFLRHAVRRERWVEDTSDSGRAAIQILDPGAPTPAMQEHWYAANPFGSSAPQGQFAFIVQQALAATQLEDFQNGPTNDLGELGVLAVHYKAQRFTIPVDGNVGKTLPVGDDGLKIEIAKYYANSMVNPRGEFQSIGDEPKNPMLQLQVHLPGQDTSIFEIAYALTPMLTAEALNKPPCPVRFWYHHPKARARPGAYFLATLDKKLYCRVAVDGAFQPCQEVHEGDRITIAPDREVTIQRFLPKAHRDDIFLPVELPPGETTGPEAAALVEISIGTTTQQFWLERNNVRSGIRTIPSDQGDFLLLFVYDRLPLDFDLKLIDFQRGLNPGRMGNASFASEVQLIDKPRGVDKTHVISMNNPLEYDRFRFYQSGFDRLPGGKEASTLTVSCDPGRGLKYLGSIMICVGILLMFVTRTSRSQQ